MSSLSQHAEDMFRELFVEATSIFERTKHLTDKVETIRESVQQYDPDRVVGKSQSVVLHQGDAGCVSDHVTTVHVVK